MKKLIILTFSLLTLFSITSTAQPTDTTQAQGGTTRDSIRMIHENIPQSRLWGNSWYVATSYSLSKTNEFDLNIGRTYGSAVCGGAGCFYSMRSYGAGFGITTKNGYTSRLAKVFWEYCFFYTPPISAGLRAEYIYDMTNNLHYLRPSAGLSLFYADIFYSYSFNLGDTNNLFKHGVTVRLKYFHRQKNWQRTYPHCC